MTEAACQNDVAGAVHGDSAGVLVEVRRTTKNLIPERVPFWIELRDEEALVLARQQPEPEVQRALECSREQRVAGAVHGETVHILLPCTAETLAGNVRAGTAAMVARAVPGAHARLQSHRPVATEQSGA